MEKIKLTDLAQEKLSKANMGNLLGGDGVICDGQTCKKKSAVAECTDIMVERNPPTRPK